MRVHALFLLGLFCLLTPATKSEAQTYTPPVPQLFEGALKESRERRSDQSLATAPGFKTPSFTIKPVEGRGVFELTARRANPLEVLQELAQLAGAQAQFDVLISHKWANSTSLSFPSAIQGTPEQLIEKVAQANQFIAKRTNNIWSFSLLQLKEVKIRTSIVENAPRWPDININPNPGKKIPEDAIPFEFNGQRNFFMPVI